MRNTKETGPGIVLAYHEVMPQSTYAYCVTCESFAQHLSLLSTISGDARSPLGAQVTFDDGEQSQYRYALPLLAKHGISATYFANPGLVGTEAKFLSWEQLKEMQAAGHS